MYIVIEGLSNKLEDFYYMNYTKTEYISKQEQEWCYKLVDILVKLGYSKRKIAEGSGISYSSVCRLSNRAIIPTKYLWENLLEYGKRVHKELHSHIEENKPINESRESFKDNIHDIKPAYVKKQSGKSDTLIWL